MKILTNTFIHVPGISKEAETRIWQNDILNWEEFIAKHDKLDMTISKREMVCEHLRKSIDCHKKNSYNFLIDSIPSSMHWRAYNELKNKCCFLDIETTGLDKHRDDVTVIGVYDGKKVKGKLAND